MESSRHIRPSHFTFSPSQQKAMTALLGFIDDPSAKVFILKGYAGTGKTTMMKEVVKKLKQFGKQYQLLASTGRAAKIMRDLTGENTSTIHACIYRYEGFNQDVEEIVKEREKNGIDSSGQLLLNFGLNTVSQHHTVFYIADEASMISDKKDKNPMQAVFGSGQLLSDLLNYDPTGKYIFIGDICQLPPVTDTQSPALSAEYIRQEFEMNVTEAELTDIMRQAKDNDIVLAAQQMRRLYYHPQPFKWAKFPLRHFQNIHVLRSEAELIQQYINYYKKYGYNDSTLICFSNRQSNTLTQVIRPALGIQNYQLTKGDLLLVTQNNYLSGLMNGDLVEVHSVVVKEKRAGLTFLEISYMDVATQREYSQLLIADILYSNQTNLTQTQQKELFVDFYIRMKDKGIKKNDEQFDKNMLEDPYLNALRAVFGFALTCHKSQGGEWNHVFLDIPRNLPLIQKPYVYQWMYTAMTRAKKELYLVDDFYLT